MHPIYEALTYQEICINVKSRHTHKINVPRIQTMSLGSRAQTTWLLIQHSEAIHFEMLTLSHRWNEHFQMILKQCLKQSPNRKWGKIHQMNYSFALQVIYTALVGPNLFPSSPNLHIHNSIKIYPALINYGIWSWSIPLLGPPGT